MITTESGTYRKHLSGELAYRTFVPRSLWDVAEIKGENQLPWHQCGEIREVAAHTDQMINSFHEAWKTADEEKRKEINDRLLYREASASVQMAYPRLPAAPDFDFSAISQLTSGTDHDSSKQTERFSLSSQKTEFDRIPEEFRIMASEDTENLFQAGERSLELLETLPVSGRFLRELHYIALYGEHYDKLYRGEFRRSPVWIGGTESDLRSAEIVPPVEEDMTHAFSDLENFLHYANDVDPLIKAALIHYQFETIHPFLDGNGRIGRLLILLYLKETVCPECPWIQLSEVLLEGIDRYYKEIRAVQLTGDYQRWTLWFLRCLDDAAAKAINCFQ